jgi:putative glutamine amidotransferase
MPGWTALAHAPDGHVEAMQHMHLPWLGMMWHPERPQGDVDAMWCWIENNIPTCEE